MYAVVSTGGKQLKVEKGTEAVVEKLSAQPGDTVTFEVLFVSDGDTVITSKDELASATVTAEVLEHFKGDKVVVFKFKKRKGYKRTKGHRQNLTRVRITDIIAVGGPKKAKAAEKPAKVEKVEKAEPKAKAAEKPAKVEKVETPAKVEKAAPKVEKTTAAKPAKAATPKVEKAAPKVEKTTPKATPAAKKAPAEHCAALKSDGDPCMNKPKEGSKYCGVHAKKYDA